MGIHVNVKRGERSSDAPFPKLMIARNNEIVLFNSSKRGTSLDGRGGYRGIYSEDWNMCEFTDFDGSVTIDNGRG